MLLFTHIVYELSLITKDLNFIKLFTRVENVRIRFDMQICIISA